jgi:hypothetical protein
MAEFRRGTSEEYWRPATASGAAFERQGLQTVGSAELCSICGTPYPVGARFCNQCGLNRQAAPLAASHKLKWNPLSDWLDLDGVRERTGLSAISLVLAALAVICMLATIMTGLLYTTATLAEWQAVQTWRIEWLLASVASLLGAILFKK